MTTWNTNRLADRATLYARHENLVRRANRLLDALDEFRGGIPRSSWPDRQVALDLAYERVAQAEFETGWALRNLDIHNRF